MVEAMGVTLVTGNQCSVGILVKEAAWDGNGGRVPEKVGGEKRRILPKGRPEPPTKKKNTFILQQQHHVLCTLIRK